MATIHQRTQVTENQF